MKLLGRWFRRKGKEPSTWGGVIVVIASVAGLKLTIEEQAAVAQAVAALVGVILIFTHDPAYKDEDEKVPPSDRDK